MRRSTAETTQRVVEVKCSRTVSPYTEAHDDATARETMGRCFMQWYGKNCGGLTKIEDDQFVIWRPEVIKGSRGIGKARRIKKGHSPQ